MQDAIQELTDALGALETAWENHDCYRETGKLDGDEIEAEAYEKGFRGALRALLLDLDVWKRQETVGLVSGTMTLDEIEAWVKRK